MPFDMLFQGRKDAFLRNTVNKHHVINVILTERKRPGCDAFHSYDDTDIDITKLSVQSSLKCLLNIISEKRIYMLLYHADHNSKPSYFKSNKN